MKFNNSSADFFVPDAKAPVEALKRTTHMAIAAHQDDIELFAYHGIAECFGRKDKWFTGVVVTDGAGSPRSGIYSSYTDADMMEIRKEEQRKAAVIGDYAAMIQLRYPSSKVKGADKAVADDIYAILEAAAPEIVYLHNPADKHDTHVATMLRAIEALRRLPDEKKPSKVYGGEVWRSLDWVNDDEKVVLSSSAYPNISAALVSVFDSQISGGKRYDLACAGRRLANATYYASHSTDQDTALSYGIDLTPLILDCSLDIKAYINAFIQRFADDVKKRLEKLV